MLRLLQDRSVGTIAIVIFLFSAKVNMLSLQAPIDSIVHIDAQQNRRKQFISRDK